MKYQVHRLKVKKETAQEKLEEFLNQLAVETVDKMTKPQIAAKMREHFCK
ncbi:MAG TPA: hypothetical protein VF451_09220 [Acidobacteriota bacterium]